MNTTLSKSNLRRSGVPEMGAGLPPFEAWVFRHLGFPLVAKALGHNAAHKLFVREGQRILYLAQDLDDFDLEQPVLVRRPMGVEDRSRHWSMELLLEHLMLMGIHVRDSVRQLRKGVRPLRRFEASDFNPKGGRSPRIREEYSRFLEGFETLFEHHDLPSEPTHTHSAFGELSAGEWLKFAAVHYKLHRSHAERIFEGL